MIPGLDLCGALEADDAFIRWNNESLIFVHQRNRQAGTHTEIDEQLMPTSLNGINKPIHKVKAKNTTDLKE